MDLIWLSHSNATGCVRKLIQDVHRKGLLPCKVNEATHVAVLCDTFLEPHVYLKKMSGASYKWNDIFYEGTNKKIIQGFSLDVSECFYHNFGGYLSWLTYYLDKLCEFRPHFKANIRRDDDIYMAENMITQKLRWDLLNVRRGMWGFRILNEQYSIYKTPEDQFYMSNNYDLNPMFFTVATLAVDRVATRGKVMKMLNDLGYNSCSCSARDRRMYHAILSLCTRGIKKVSGTNRYVQQVREIANSLLRKDTDIEVQGIGKQWLQEGVRHIIIDKTRQMPYEVSHTEQEVLYPVFDEVRFFNQVHKEKQKRLRKFLSWRIDPKLVIFDRGLSTEGAKKMKEVTDLANGELSRTTELNWDSDSNFSEQPEKDYAKREVVRNVVMGYTPVTIRTHKQYKKYEINECYRPFLAEKLGEIVEMPGFIPLKAATMPYIYTHEDMRMLRAKVTAKGVGRPKKERKILSIKASQDIEEEIKKFKEENAEMLRIENICVNCLNYITEKAEHESEGKRMYRKAPYPKRVVKFAITALKLATEGGNLGKALDYCYKRDILMTPAEREKKLEAERRRIWLLKNPKEAKKLRRKGDLKRLSSVPGLAYLSAVPLKKKKPKKKKPGVDEGRKFIYDVTLPIQTDEQYFAAQKKQKEIFRRLYGK